MAAHGIARSIRRNLQHFCYFLGGQTSKKAHLDYSCLARIPSFKSLQGVIYCDQVFGSSTGNHKLFIERHLYSSTTTLVVVPAPCEIDEYPPHELRRDAKKLSTVLPLHSAVIDEFQVGFVD